MASSKDVYRIYSRFYDDYTDDVFADLPLYRSQCHPGMRILEVGCGTGRILQSVIDLPVQLIGVDISREMLDISEKKLADPLKRGQLVLLEHDFLENKLDAKVDQIWITYFTFNYVLEDGQKFLQNAVAGLRKGGRLILDLFVPDTLIDPAINGVERTFDPFPSQGSIYHVKDLRFFDGTFEKRRVVFDNESDDCVVMETVRRYYSIDEICGMLTSLGLKIVEAHYGYCGDKIIDHNFIVIAVK